MAKKDYTKDSKFHFTPSMFALRACPERSQGRVTQTSTLNPEFPYLYITMPLLLRYFFTLILIFASMDMMSQTTIDFDDGYYVIDGKRVFLKGIGYEHNARPGQLPWEDHFNEEEMRFDMERICQAGFNTLRTWDAFSVEELDLISEYELYIIMGIWIDPHGDFSSPSFVADAENKVKSIMSYSINYDNIIGYIIMNEPLPETIFEAGYTATVDLWNKLIGIIHQQHPGIPVSIANTPNGTYIDPQIFDISAYNVYIYNPVTVNHSHRYSAYIDYLRSLRQDDHPLVITEFGLSVSPSGPGNWGYGGNTTSEQSDGNLFMYRAAIDGGATGACMFNYADGWWKGGDEYSHDDHPEEWFGLIYYENLQDHLGTPRPVWGDVAIYNRAIICSPQNGGTYAGDIPIEFFLQDTITSVQVLKDGNVVHNSLTLTTYYTDTLILGNSLEDVGLIFRFFNSDYDLVKEEVIQILITDQNWQMPELTLQTSLDSWYQSEQVDISIEISHEASLNHSAMLDYATYRHQGFDYGIAYQEVLPISIVTHNFSYSEYITEQSPVITFAAGYDMIYGDFRKRVYDQELIVFDGYLGLEPDKIAEEKIYISVYPNPSNDHFIFTYDDLSLSGVPFAIFDIRGQLVMEDVIRSAYQYDLDNLSPGIYVIRVFAARSVATLSLVVQ